MSRYIINGTVDFDSALATLKIIDSSTADTMQLSAPAARSLELLINAHGQVINKNIILEKAWREYGFVVTDNSVNQVVSHIRKSFNRLGCKKDIIITVPRLGYQFNPVYTVDKKEAFAEPIVIINEDAPQMMMKTEAAFHERNNYVPRMNKVTSRITRSGVMRYVLLPVFLGLFFQLSFADGSPVRTLLSSVLNADGTQKTTLTMCQQAKATSQ